MTAKERFVEGGLGAAFLVAATLVAVVGPWGDRSTTPLLLIALVALYVLASAVEFEVGSGRAVPEQLVFVPMLFLVPLPLVPLLVAAGFLLARVPLFLRGQEHPERCVNALTDAWFSIGPVVVLSVLAPGAPELKDLDVYGLAFVAQVVVGGLTAVVGERYGYGIPPMETLRAASWSYALDAALSPVALALAFAADESYAALLAIPPLVWVLDLFARERTARFGAMLELNRAYQGTVMLISDFVEFDDSYTADHCRTVVELVDAVADELRVEGDQATLAPGSRRELEFVALLHDVGKVAVPNEILNKPGPLAPHEQEVMGLHTVEGQRMLERVGGALARVGEIVRSCHERWDGGGYPDGLTGEEIPLAARIVFCCDAYCAMTTDRTYRAAMPSDAALAEIRGGSGTQFDPRVAAALATVVEREQADSRRAARAMLSSERVSRRVGPAT